MTPTITAAICTHSRPVQLHRALSSLLRQTAPPAEVVVVDNAPADDRTRRLLEERFPGVRYLAEPVTGLDFARNRAIVAAAGDIVAFLDDDAVADPGWTAAIAETFRAVPGLAACLGRIEALELATAGQRLFEANGGFGRGADRIVVRPGHAPRLRGLPVPLVAWAVSLGSGCNLAVRRDVVRELGGFDEALDLGAALPGGGDLDIVWRMLEADHPVAYEPAARVRHEHRRDLDAVIQQIIGHHRGLIAMLAKGLARARGRRRLELLAFLGWRLLKPGVRLARRAVGRDPLPAPVLLRLWAACWAALLDYPAARRTARRRRAGLRPGPAGDEPAPASARPQA